MYLLFHVCVVFVFFVFFFFFFKQKTAYEMRISDWSSDVCSSDLWNPWLIWHSVDLPHEAFERMAQGGVWRIQEPRPDPFRFEVYPGEAYANQETIRVAVYKLGRALGYGSAVVLGQWEGEIGRAHV